MRFFNKTLVLFLFSAFLMIAAAPIYYSARLMLFPETLQLISGRESNFNFGFPYDVAFEPSALAVSVNDKPVKENIKIETTGNISIKPETTGEMNMEISFLGIKKDVKLTSIEELELVPCGMTVGVWMRSDGLMVLGTGTVNGLDGKSYSPSDGKLQPGDIILQLNKQEVQNKKQLISALDSSKSNEEIIVTYKRGTEIKEVPITPVRSIEDQKNKLGCWVRESTKGIGTMTYYNPKTNTFGALGHGILDVDTKKLMSLKSGEIMESDIVAIKKGRKGSPGELIGNINDKKIYGFIKANTSHGLYGYVKSDEGGLPTEALKVALQSDIHEGPAIMLSNVSGKEVKKYDVYIESVNRFSSDDSKGMVVQITDAELISKTNGIVQGMSGSPLIQDGKLIGAITHVFVQNPMKGYGIFIENMIKQEMSIE